MIGNSFTTAAYVSYALALVGYGLFALRVLLGWRRSARAALLAGAVAASALWAAGALLTVEGPTGASLLLMDFGDLARYGLWFAFLGSLLRGSNAGAGAGIAPRSRGLLRASVAAALVACLLLTEGLPFGAQLGVAGAELALALHLGLPIFGLVLLEHLMRRTHEQMRWSLRPMAIALGGIFVFDLCMYSYAMLFNRVDLDFWIARGVVHALVIPFLVVATARNTGWTVEMHVSRGAVFHSTALLASGAFLLAVAAAGYLVRYVGGEWGRTVQIELLFAALLCVAVVATSGRFRSKLRVFVSKHFFSYRYDYREEWLRLTRTLSHDEVQSLRERSIMALANLVESAGGAIWIKDDDGTFAAAGRYNVAQPVVREPAEGSLPRFLARTGWVVELAEFAADRSRYAGLELPAWLRDMPNAWLVAPLPSGTELVGFVVLTSPRVPVVLNWEVLDIIKTASRQAASYIAHARATEALLETRKFDAFNRMSAFVVHDLKNLISQLSLMIRNAERHRDNPEFQRDMLDTVRHVVERMNGLMLQLRTGAAPVARPHVLDLGRLVQRVCAAKSEAGRAVDVAVDAPVASIAHEDRLDHVIAHLVQNALDASPADARVRVQVLRDGGNAVIEVADQGSGMSEEYVRDRLGRPFETTKSAGMGIGVYESTQYVASLGGRVIVDSGEGRGTRVSVVLPLAAPDAQVTPHTEPA